MEDVVISEVVAGDTKTEQSVGERCPDCGNLTVRASGCLHCPVCGWGRCG